MELDEKYTRLAKAHIEKLKREKPQIPEHHDSVKVCLEAYPLEPGEYQDPHYKLRLFDDQTYRGFCNTPTIPLPNCKHCFYFVWFRSELIRYLEHQEGAATFRAESWEDLYESDYENKHFVFKTNAKRRTLGDKYILRNLAFSELQNGDECENVKVTGVISGDKTPVFELTEHWKGSTPSLRTLQRSL